MRKPTSNRTQDIPELSPGILGGGASTSFLLPSEVAGGTIVLTPPGLFRGAPIPGPGPFGCTVVEAAAVVVTVVVTVVAVVVVLCKTEAVEPS